MCTKVPSSALSQVKTRAKVPSWEPKRLLVVAIAIYRTVSRACMYLRHQKNDRPQGVVLKTTFSCPLDPKPYHAQ